MALGKRIRKRGEEEERIEGFQGVFRTPQLILQHDVVYIGYVLVLREGI